MLQERKYWAKNDLMYLSDVNGLEPPVDQFKKNRLIQYKRKLDVEVTEKPNNKPVPVLIKFDRSN